MIKNLRFSGFLAFAICSAFACTSEPKNTAAAIPPEEKKEVVALDSASVKMESIDAEINARAKAAEAALKALED